MAIFDKYVPLGKIKKKNKITLIPEDGGKEIIGTVELAVDNGSGSGMVILKLQSSNTYRKYVPKLYHTISEGLVDDGPIVKVGSNFYQP